MTDSPAGGELILAQPRQTSSNNVDYVHSCQPPGAMESVLAEYITPRRVLVESQNEHVSDTPSMGQSLSDRTTNFSNSIHHQEHMNTTNNSIDSNSAHSSKMWCPQGDLELSREVIRLREENARLKDELSKATQAGGSGAQQSLIASETAIGTPTHGPVMLNIQQSRRVGIEFDQRILDHYVDPASQDQLVQEIIASLVNTIDADDSGGIIGHLNRSTPEKMWWSPDVLEEAAGQLLFYIAYAQANNLALFRNHEGQKVKHNYYETFEDRYAAVIAPLRVRKLLSKQVVDFRKSLLLAYGPASHTKQMDANRDVNANRNGEVKLAKSIKRDRKLREDPVLSEFTIPQLKEACQERGLPRNGNKANLIARLEKWNADQVRIEQELRDRVSSGDRQIDAGMQPELQGLIPSSFEQLPDQEPRSIQWTGPISGFGEQQSNGFWHKIPYYNPNDILNSEGDAQSAGNGVEGNNEGARKRQRQA